MKQISSNDCLFTQIIESFGKNKEEREGSADVYSHIYWIVTFLTHFTDYLIKQELSRQNFQIDVEKNEILPYHTTFKEVKVTHSF